MSADKKQLTKIKIFVEGELAGEQMWMNPVHRFVFTDEEMEELLNNFGNDLIRKGVTPTSNLVAQLAIEYLKPKA